MSPRSLAMLHAFADRHGLHEGARDELAALLRGLHEDARGPTSSGTWGPEDTDGGGPFAPAPLSRNIDAGGRYEDRGLIARGGMGEVRRALDRLLNRVVAMKVLRPELLDENRLFQRFFEEAQVTARLQHPGIVPIHDLGELRDGRPWFTMPEVEGRTLSSVIRELHGRTEEGPGWTLRRVVDAFRKACEAVAFAHARGVVHRDLKPDNIMIGAFGEVLVMDWGLAKVLSRPEPAGLGEGAQCGEGADTTRMGSVFGTPNYMAPEQALGLVDRIDARSDVFSLGGILYRVLTGRRPYAGRSGDEVLAQAREARIDEAPLFQPGVPEELARVAQRALSRRHELRHADAGALAADLTDWLEGLRRREGALALMRQAARLTPEVQRLRAEARFAGLRAARLGRDVAPAAPVEAKRDLWAAEDEARRLARDAELLREERAQLLHAALNHAPELDELHRLLADHYQELHAEAEARRDTLAAATLELRLRAHDRGAHARYLRGQGRLTLLTDPEDAEVELWRHEERDRLRVAVPVTSLGRAPIVDVELPMGDHLLRLHAPGREALLYPVRIGRTRDWTGTPPGASGPRAVALPRVGDLGPDDVPVPAGWALVGGDPDAANALPAQRIWVDAFVIQRHPVTHRQVLAFLNDLLAQGREDEALAFAPSERGALLGERGPLAYGRDAEGRFVLTRDRDGDLWDPDWPAFLMTWSAARAYAAWLGAREGLPWRLPTELEWEKAGRGADGRIFPWGDTFDPTFTTLAASQTGRLTPRVVGQPPSDRSVYGVCGLAGNVRDWTLDLAPRAGEPLETCTSLQGGRARVVQPPSPLPEGATVITRGGAWMGGERAARLASRHATHPEYRSNGIGFRLARSLDVGTSPQDP